MTHKDIVQLLARQGKTVRIGTVIAWGGDGLLGDPVIPFPKHYKTSDVLKRLPQIKDKRLKLTDAQVVELLDDFYTGEWSQRALAVEYGVHESMVSRIIRGERRVAV